MGLCSGGSGLLSLVEILLFILGICLLNLIVGRRILRGLHIRNGVLGGSLLRVGLRLSLIFIFDATVASSSAALGRTQQRRRDRQRGAWVPHSPKRAVGIVNSDAGALQRAAQNVPLTAAEDVRVFQPRAVRDVLAR